MKPINLISAVDSGKKFNDMGLKDNNLNINFNLKNHEVTTLLEFINMLKKCNANFRCFNGYYVGYVIGQINKEFDLLRFSDDYIINIELKSPLKQDEMVKIEEQMNKNCYYLKFLSKKMYLYTYVERDGLYFYNNDNKNLQRADINNLITLLNEQKVNYSISPDDLFVPSNYLVSPFNNPEIFLNGGYFLTSHQQDIKREIIKTIESKTYKLFCISANAGTGKTLLIYDIAKYLRENKLEPLIVHCGKLNIGHNDLNKQNWKITSVSNINKAFLDQFNEHFPTIIIIDEAQRIRRNQLELILTKSKELHIPLIFSYDIKQYLKTGESNEIYEYVSKEFSKDIITKFVLKDKIRTNKHMASFIKNLIHIGDAKENLNYENITIEYMEKKEDVRHYMYSLETDEGWKAITFTNSRFTIEPLDNLAYLCANKAHDVIGQEFEKVVLVMDENFKYNEDGILMYKDGNYYSPKGMLYQIVTRAVKELKIIVLNNSELFYKLLEIKYLTFLKR